MILSEASVVACAGVLCSESWFKISYRQASSIRIEDDA